jgi:hypothetical protein
MRDIWSEKSGNKPMLPLYSVYSSSAELVNDRYAVQAIPTVDTNGCDSRLAPSIFVMLRLHLQFGIELA